MSAEVVASAPVPAGGAVDGLAVMSAEVVASAPLPAGGAVDGLAVMSAEVVADELAVMTLVCSAKQPNQTVAITDPIRIPSSVG